MAEVDWDELNHVTASAVEDVLDAMGPLSRELGVAAGLENPAVPMVVALELLPQVVGASAACSRRLPFLSADAPLTVHASIVAGLIVLLADALLAAVSEEADSSVLVGASN